MIRVRVDEDVCVTTGQCARALPEVFRLREEDGVSVVVDPQPPAELHQELRAAAGRCPVVAIMLEG